MAFDQNKYVADFKRENYDAVTFLIPKGEKAALKQRAQIDGISVSQLVVRALEEFYKLDLGK
jgi:hypothetical protein